MAPPIAAPAGESVTDLPLAPVLWTLRRRPPVVRLGHRGRHPGREPGGSPAVYHHAGRLDRRLAPGGG
eukprot:7000984-Alexandrium_andersonii.AAC.1